MMEHIEKRFFSHRGNGVNGGGKTEKTISSFSYLSYLSYLRYLCVKTLMFPSFVIFASVCRAKPYPCAKAGG